MIMAFLEIDGKIIHSTDIAGVEEKRVTVKVPVQVDNPEPKPSKGLLAKLMYSDTIKKTIELDYTVIELKVKGVIKTATKVDQDTGAISNSSHQLYDFYSICGDCEFLKAMACASNKKDVELQIGNFYCYPGMLAYPDYMKTNVIIDEEITSKSDFVDKYINNLPIKKKEPAEKRTLQAAIDEVKKPSVSTTLKDEWVSGSKFICEIVTFTKEAGGRHAPFFSHFMPKFSFGKSNPPLTGTIILPADVECCNPGDNARVTIAFDKKIRINKGVRFSIVENEKAIGFGTLIDVVE